MNIAALRVCVLSASNDTPLGAERSASFTGVFSEFITQRYPSKKICSEKDPGSSDENLPRVSVEEFVEMLRDTRSDSPILTLLRPMWQELVCRVDDSDRTDAEKCHAVTVSVPKDIRFLLSIPDRLASTVTLSGRADVTSEQRDRYRRAVFKIALVQFVEATQETNEDIPSTFVSLSSWKVLRELFEIVLRLDLGRLLVAVIPQVLRETSASQTVSVQFLLAACLAAQSSETMLTKLVHCLVTEWITDSGEGVSLFRGVVVPFLEQILALSFGILSDENGEMQQWTLLRDLVIVNMLLTPLPRTMYETLFSVIESCPARQTVAFQAWLRGSFVSRVLQQWDSAELLQRGDVVSSLALGNVLSYCFDLLSDVMTSLGAVDVQHLLNGISKRFEATRHTEVREVAARIATQYAALTLPSAEDVPQFDEFPDVVQKWRNGKHQPAAMIDDTKLTPKPPQADDVPTLRCGSLLDTEDVANPDQPFPLFRWAVKGTEVNCSEASHIVSTRSNKQSNIAVGLISVPSETSAVDGKVPVYRTIAEAFDALCGTRRSTSETERQAQDRLEGALRALPQLLRDIFEQHEMQSTIGISSTATISSVTGIATVVLDVLSQTPLSFPPSLQQEMDVLRSQVFSLLIMIAPKHTLPHISEAIIQNRNSLFMKLELLKSVQKAAESLANVPVVEVGSVQGPRSGAALYPPIPRNSSNTTAVVRIHATEGRNTRRWGYAHKGRNTVQSNRYRNLLADVADLFFSCVLAEGMRNVVIEADTMPFVGAQIVKTLSVLFHELRNARHIVPKWCAVTVPWTLHVVQHVNNGDVRGLAWMLVADALVAWRGTSSTPSMDCLLIAKTVYDLATTLLSREVDVLVKRCIVRVIVLVGELHEETQNPTSILS